MNEIFLFISIIIFCSMSIFSVNAKDVSNYVPTSELKAGQIITGYTVVNGTLPTKFTAEIIGLKSMAYFNGLEATVVIYAQMISGPCLPGIVSGMSGSPMYAKDGRIIGLAAAGFFGGEPVSPIFMINPIEEILDYVPKSENKEQINEQKQIGPSKEKTTLYTNGFNINMLEKTMPQFNIDTIASKGVSNSAVDKQNKEKSILDAGSAINAYIVYGDMEMYFHGTVGYLVYPEKGNIQFGAFGHSCLNKGEVEIPIKKASVFGLMYTLFSDFKIIGVPVTDFIGKITYDKYSVYGELFKSSKKELDIDNISVKQSIFNQQELLASKKCHVIKIPGMTVDVLNNVLTSTLLLYYSNYGIETKTIECQISLIFSNKDTIMINHSFAAGSTWGVANSFLGLTNVIFKQAKDTDILRDLKQIEMNINFSDVKTPNKKKKLTIQIMK